MSQLLEKEEEKNSETSLPRRPCIIKTTIATSSALLHPRTFQDDIIQFHVVISIQDKATAPLRPRNTEFHA
jgi:hypothetical protein